MRMIFQIAILVLFLNEVSSIRVFLMGGAVDDNETQIYETLAKATGKIPTPNKCVDDWKITNCPKIAVITSAAPTEQDGNDAYNIDDPDDDSLSYKSLFEKYGYSPKHISVHIDNYQRTTDLNESEGQLNLQIISQADIIFFNGGDQSRHIRSWLNDNAQQNAIMKIINKKASNNQVILAGTSAGSMAMCSPIYGNGLSYGHLYFAASIGLAQKNVTDGGVNGSGTADTRNGSSGLQYQDNGGMMVGFGFVPFLVDTHFDCRGRIGRMIPALFQMRKDFGIGIDESTAFFYEDGRGKVYGKNGVFIIDMRQTILNTKTFFSIYNVSVTYLTSGDEINFFNNKIVVQGTKRQIVIPTYSTYTDSYNIFGEYENTLLVTRIVDQVPIINFGRSVIPDYYPKNAPIVKLIYWKYTHTKGFYSQSKKKYTAVSVVIDFTYQ